MLSKVNSTHRHLQPSVQPVTRELRTSLLWPKGRLTHSKGQLCAQHGDYSFDPRHGVVCCAMASRGETVEPRFPSWWDLAIMDIRPFVYTILVLAASLLLAVGGARAQTVKGGGTAETETQTLSVSGNSLTFLDALGTRTNSWEVHVTGGPTTLTVTVAGIMPSGTSTTLGSSTATTDSVISTGGGPFQKYTVTGTWTGGASPTIVVNRIGSVSVNTPATPLGGAPVVGVNGIVASGAYVSASVFEGTNADCPTPTNGNGSTDWSNAVNQAWKAAPTRGATIDARGGLSLRGVVTVSVAYAGQCNPFACSSGGCAHAYNLLLPAAPVYTSVSWVLPRRGGRIQGIAPGDSSNINTGRGSYLIECNNAAVGQPGSRYGCGTAQGISFGNATFPSNGYTLLFAWAHGPAPGFPPVLFDTKGSCGNLPKVIITALAGTTLVGASTFALNAGGGGCTATPPTCFVAWGGTLNESNSGSTCTPTIVGGNVTGATFTGGSGYVQTVGVYAPLINIGGEADNGDCGHTPQPITPGSACDGMGDTGGALIDAFDSTIEWTQLSADDLDNSILIYTRNEQELSGGTHLELHDLGNRSFGIFLDNSDVFAPGGGENSHAIHGTFSYIQGTLGTNASDAPGSAWVVNTAASTMIGFNDAGCHQHPMATVTAVNSTGDPTTGRVTYNGAQTPTDNAGCGATKCGIISATGTGILCAATVGANGSQTNVITAVALSGSGNGAYPNFTHSAPPEISNMTLNGQDATHRIGAGVILAGTQAHARGIHCEQLKPTGVNLSCGWLTNTRTGACVRVGCGWDNPRGGLIAVVDTANNTAAANGNDTAVNFHYGAGGDNALTLVSVNQNLGNGTVHPGRLIQDDNNDPVQSNNGGLGPTGCANGCTTGTVYQGDYFGRADGYSPGGQWIGNFIQLGSPTSSFDATSGVPDLSLSRVGTTSGTGALSIGSGSNGDGSAMLLAGGNLMEVSADFTTTSGALVLITGLTKPVPAVSNAQVRQVACHILYSANPAQQVSFAVVTTVSAQPMIAWGNAFTADGVAHETPAGGTGVINTTTPTPALTITPTVTTVLEADVYGTIELAAFGSTTVNVDANIAAAATFTAKRGSQCAVR
jgi:hypothetical protein